jgi:hypothetical protein
LRSGVLPALRDLAREGPVEIVVRGSCMAPGFADGERVRIVAARRYWPGDVVAFEGRDGRLRLHRLLGYRLHAGRLACLTRGDGCPCHDDPVPLDHLLGRVADPSDAAAPPLRRLAVRARAVLAAFGIVARRLLAR